MIFISSFIVGGGIDYTDVMSLDLTFSAMDTQFEVEIPIINDTLAESDEVFQVDLSTSNSDVNLSPASGIVTIQDDDGKFSQLLNHIRQQSYTRLATVIISNNLKM